MIRKFTLGLIFLSLITACVSCEKEDDTPDNSPKEETKPWKVQINMGNFSINSGTILIYEDGKSIDMLDDYVMESALPNVDFELMGIQAWIPTEEGLSTTVTKARVQMSTETGIRTGNIFHDGFSRFRERVQYDGILYSVYDVFGFYNHSQGAIRPDNFANVSFELEIKYEKDSDIVASRMITLGVYKRK